MSESVDTIRKDIIKAVETIIKGELNKPPDSKTTIVLQRILRKIKRSFPY